MPTASLPEMRSERVNRARPQLIRAAIAGLLALAANIVAINMGGRPFQGDLTTSDLIRFAAVAGIFVFGIIAVRAVVQAVKDATAHAGTPRGTPVSFFVSIAGYIVVLIVAMAALGQDVGGLLLGGAFTGIVLGIAAQQAFGNFIAGIVLLLVRPFSVGDHIFLRGSPIGGEYEGTVVEMSLFYVHLQAPHGPVLLPNAGVLASAVGPGARTTGPDDEKDEDKEQEPPPAHGGAPTGGPPTP